MLQRHLKLCAEDPLKADFNKYKEHYHCTQPIILVDDINSVKINKQVTIQYLKLYTTECIKHFQSKANTLKEKLTLAKFVKLSGIYQHLNRYHYKNKVMTFVECQFQSNELKVFGYTLIQSKPFQQIVSKPLTIEKYITSKLDEYRTFCRRANNLRKNRMFICKTKSSIATDLKLHHYMIHNGQTIDDITIKANILSSPNANLKLIDLVKKSEFMKAYRWKNK